MILDKDDRKIRFIVSNMQDTLERLGLISKTDAELNWFYMSLRNYWLEKHRIEL
jgi:hypothetical protein